MKTQFDAFVLLKEYLQGMRKNRIIVFLEELPYMDTPQSYFLAAIGLKVLLSAYPTPTTDYQCVIVNLSACYPLFILHQEHLKTHFVCRVFNLMYFKML